MPLKPLTLTRRESIRIGAAGFLGIATRDLLAFARADARAKSCIVVWLNGGPSHVDTFDLKPDAPREIAGEFRPIPSSIDGLQICEHLPRIAKEMRRCALVRSVTSPEGNHDRATHYMLTGWRPSPALVYPALGSVAAKEAGGGAELPRYVAVPAEIQWAGAGYLTAAFEPFSIGSNPARDGYRVRDLDAPVAPDRFSRRREMLRSVDELSRLVEASASRDASLEQAYRLITSKEAHAAFDLGREKPETRASYGFSTLGQSCLLARRLVEAGVRFVTVNDDGWDTHQGIFKVLSTGFPGKLPELDMAFSSLVRDLDDRGLLDSTLVVLMGDFGRTPKLNSAGGRDHWPRASSVLLAGGGIRRAAVHGTTDATGELPATDPVEPGDIAATIYDRLGIDFTKEYRTPQGRPVKVLGRGRVVEEVIL
jgi:hypothetical protein